jgi:lipopolysaccharide transport system ATP-binding protein
VDYVSETVIKVENLGKKYVLSHQRKASSYKALRDVIADGTKSLGKKILRPNGKTLIEPTQEEFWALKDVSFEIKQGDRIGIIGRNGAGKSTLLKILSRITEPTHGRIAIKGRIASLLEVGTGFHPELTGRENIYLNGAILGMSKLEIKKNFDRIIEFAEIEKFLDTPVKRYSSGMYVRLAFAVAAHLDPEILIIDEVLAVGDQAFQDKCLGKMEEVSASGRTVIFVSHNMDSIRKLCSLGLLLKNGSIIEYGQIENVVSGYLTQHSEANDNGIIHFKKKNNTEYYIDRIELLQIDGRRKSDLKTWDPVKFRIFFHSPNVLKSGSVVLKISTLSGATIALCSTYPDSNVKVEFAKGLNQVDCIFPKLSLSAGKYLIGAALAIPNSEWLYQELEHSTINVSARDVYSSGLAPHNSRYLLALEHSWESKNEGF